MTSDEFDQLASSQRVAAMQFLRALWLWEVWNGPLIANTQPLLDPQTMTKGTPNANPR